MMHPMPTLFDVMLSDAVFDNPLVYRPTARHGLCVGARGATPQVQEKEKEYTITVTAPGIRSEDLSVSVEDGTLKIQGETETNVHTHFANWTTHLPRDADAEKATASHVDGLLMVKIPKKEVVKTTIALLPDGETTPGDDEDAEHFYTMRLNCAGIAKADLILTIEDALLTVSGETKSRGVQLPTRKYRLPDDADGEKASASYVDGILTIAVPKKAAALPKRIQLTLNAEPEEKKSADAEDAAMEAKDDEEAEMVEGAGYSDA